MATARSYEDIRDSFGCYYMSDIGTINIHKGLTQAGIEWKNTGRMLAGRKALVSFFVKELENGMTGMHMCYWNGSELIDPSNKPREHQKIMRIIEISS